MDGISIMMQSFMERFTGEMLPKILMKFGETPESIKQRLKDAQDSVKNGFLHFDGRLVAIQKQNSEMAARIERMEEILDALAGTTPKPQVIENKEVSETGYGPNYPKIS